MPSCDPSSIAVAKKQGSSDCTHRRTSAFSLSSRQKCLYRGPGKLGVNMGANTGLISSPEESSMWRVHAGKRIDWLSDYVKKESLFVINCSVGQQY